MLRKILLVPAIWMALIAFTWSADDARAQNQGGVTLYADGDYRGTSQTFYGDEADLRRTRVGGGQASSVHVDAGCRAILYSGVAFQGRSSEITRDTPSLKGSVVGNDGAFSLRVLCGPVNQGPGFQQPGFNPSQSGAPDLSGVTMFWRINFHGRSHFFSHGNHPDLGQIAFGHNQASSIILDEGCQATLYELPNFRGRSVTLQGNERQLGLTALGDNMVSSLQVSCVPQRR